MKALIKIANMRELAAFGTAFSPGVAAGGLLGAGIGAGRHWSDLLDRIAGSE